MVAAKVAVASTRIVVYAAPASPAAHFSAKVLVALDAYGIKHSVSFVHVVPEKRKLPSGGTVVPEVDFGSSIGVVGDSETILRTLDEKFGAALFPSELAGELSRRASDGILLACALYYNLVHEPTYKKTTHAHVEAMIPWFFCCFRGLMAEKALGPFRTKNGRKALLGNGARSRCPRLGGVETREQATTPWADPLR